MTINAVIWKKCPKDIYTSRKILEIGVNSAVISFNDGALASKQILSSAGVHVGKFTIAGLQKLDKVRIKSMTKKASKKGKQRRKTLLAVKKGYIDKENDQEKTPAYAAGLH